MADKEVAKRLARAALCGFFGTDGFADMEQGQRKQAVKAVLKEMEKDDESRDGDSQEGP